MAETVSTELVNGIFTITMNRPPVNALSLEMIKSLQLAFKSADQLSDARVVLLRGSGGIFSAGQDVREMLQVEDESYRKHMLETYNPLIVQARRIEKPVVAEIEGTVAGAALGLALACDLRLASEEARFLVGFLGLGLALDSAISLFLPALVGLGRATELAYLNVPLSAQHALLWGLVNRVTPADNLHICALEFVEALKNGPIHAMGLAKRDFNKAIYPHLEQVLDYEAHIQEIAHLGSEHQEGLKAFAEKRKPVYG